MRIQVLTYFYYADDQMHLLGFYWFPFTDFCMLQYYSMKIQVINELQIVCMDYSFYDKNIFSLEMQFNILGRRNALCVNISLVDATAIDMIEPNDLRLCHAFKCICQTCS